MNLDQILKFVEFTHKFQKILRGVYVTGLDRKENDLEHSAQLALIAFYLISTFKLKFNHEKIIKYALIHDLVETYAGDTDFYLATSTEKDSKEEREQKAKERIKKEFENFIELGELLDAYDLKQDEESNFIYALDKLLVKINVYLDKGKGWKEDKITFEMFMQVEPKITKSKEVKKIWDEFVDLVKQKKHELFNNI